MQTDPTVDPFADPANQPLDEPEDQPRPSTGIPPDMDPLAPTLSPEEEEAARHARSAPDDDATDAK